MKPGYTLTRFDSYEDYLAAAIAPTDMVLGDRSSRLIGRSSAWDNGLGFDEAMAVARTGDIEEASRISPAVLSRANALVIHQARFDPEARLDGGHFIDVARYVNGEPECWVEMVEQKKQYRAGVGLVINTIVSANAKAHQIRAVGTAIASVVLGLQAMGHPVMVYMCDSNMGHVGHARINATALNAQGRALDLSKLVAMLQPWFLRRVTFSVWETWPKAIRTRYHIAPGGGYGEVGHLTMEQARDISGMDKTVNIDVSRFLNAEKEIQGMVLAALK